MQAEKKQAEQADPAEAARQIQAALEKAALKAKPVSLEGWQKQAERCETPLGRLVHEYAVRQILDSNLTENRPTTYNATVLSKAPGWSSQMEVAAEEMTGSKDKAPEFMSMGSGRELGADEAQKLQTLPASEWRQIRITEPADFQEKLRRAHEMANDLAQSAPEKAVRLAHEGVVRRMKIAQDGAAYAAEKLPSLGDEPPVTADSKSAAWADQIDARHTWQRDREYFHALTIERYPGEFQGMLRDELFKPPKLDVKPAETGRRETERQRRITELVSESELSRQWMRQAERVHLPVGDALERIMYSHVKRASYFPSMDLLTKPDMTSQDILAMPPEDLIARAEQDFRERGVIWDKLINPSAGSRSIEVKLHTFRVQDQSGGKASPFEGIDVAEYTEKHGMGYVWAVLKVQAPRKLPAGTEFEETSEMERMGEDQKRRIFQEWGQQPFQYMGLRELVDGIKGEHRSKSGGELDDRVALVSVGRYLAQQNVRVFGVPTYVRLTDPSSVDRRMSQIETTDDLIRVIGDNARRIELTVEKDPYPAVAMDGVIKRCFPYKPGDFRLVADKVRAEHPERRDQDRFCEDLAYLALGYLMQKGGRINVATQEDAIVIGHPHLKM
jgi:hypothetical protein